MTNTPHAMETKRINVTILEIDHLFWFKDPDDFDQNCPLDISNIGEMSLDVPTLDSGYCMAHSRPGQCLNTT